ncbi:uncharacterized protein LOC108113256 [Drosophila eugracilis]|uniref:uncharacterized protein LOC108113256 n=1 Tax=Drosophila eugracilis TaxID=29029 RepID=UPI0007E84CBF|nr:uncharacterized protein LOC108113256 [Drosophila eugracilis]
MSNTSVRPIPTLKGMFSVPRVTQSRNFLKENKVSLRSLEKSTTQKLAAKEPIRPKWMPPLRRTSSEVRESKTEKPPVRGKLGQQNSQNARSNSRSQHQLAVAIPADGERFDGLEERNPILYDPTDELEGDNILEPSSDPMSDRCQSCGTNRSSTSIGIQTEDITDELYLTNALKKCNVDSRSIMEDPGLKYEINYRPERYDNEEDLEQLPLSARSNTSKHSRFQVPELEAIPMTEAEPLNYGACASDDEAPLSARSRFTTASNVTTITSKSKRRDHELGSRDNVRLPRYLEKQKREKAVAKQLADSQDPDCPRGHVLLSDQDRLTHLTNAKKRFGQLVDELNHMPMTKETLRVRNRKAEIDRELTTVEEDIRIYSKAKVFVLANKSRQL